MTTCHIFLTVRSKNFKVGVQMEDVDPHQRQAPWSPRLKTKVTRLHTHVTWYVWPVWNLHLVLWQSTQTRMTDNRCSRWPPRSKVKVISSRRLYVLSLLLLHSGNNMLYLCHVLEVGGGIPCRPNPAATLLVQFRRWKSDAALTILLVCPLQYQSGSRYNSSDNLWYIQVNAGQSRLLEWVACRLT